MGKENSRQLSYRFAHVGINPVPGQGMEDGAAFFSGAFGFPSFDVGTSVIVAGPMELLKAPGPGRNGHLGIETEDVEEAIRDLAEKGFSIEESTLTYRSDGLIQSVYLKEEFCGFAVHLLRKR